MIENLDNTMSKPVWCSTKRVTTGYTQVKREKTRNNEQNCGYISTAKSFSTLSEENQTKY